ncbi:MAG TPA: polymer-forming cytoskeletal protein [Roseiflexaceae bacterium]|nr:polymer-forming cytoskeletal protein [Roseiflexaceae bacterium]
MFGRRNPDRPLDVPLPDEHDTEELNLDLLDDLPDILEADSARPAESVPPVPAPQEQPAAPAPDPAWQASTPSILGPSVTRMLQTRAEEEAVPRTDLGSPPPRTPVPPVFQNPPPVAAPVMQQAAAAAPAEPAQRTRAIAESVIGPDDFFDGRYRSERGVRIQGNARGSIESRQYIFVEAGAQVEADLSAEDITVSGDFKGKISCRRRLEVTSSGKIHGQVQTELLVVQEGGALDGELHMRGDQSEAGENQ